MHPQVSRPVIDLGAQWTVVQPRLLQSVVSILLVHHSRHLMGGNVLLQFSLIRKGVQTVRAAVWVLLMLAHVSTQVLGKSKCFPAVTAAKGLFTCVQILMLVQEAGIVEALTTQAAVIRTLLGVSPSVILHDGAMPEDHPTLGTSKGLESSVGPLMNPQCHSRLKTLVALQTAERIFQGVCLHVGSDGHSILKLLAA